MKRAIGATMGPPPERRATWPADSCAFTLVELLAIIAVLALWASMLLPVSARTNLNSKAFQCLNNLRQLTKAWTMYSAENRDLLLTSQDGPPPGRVNWVNGLMDFNGANRSNWDTNQDLVKSPLWPYVGRDAALFRCTADRSAVRVQGTNMPRVRSISLSHAFGRGGWLDREFNSWQQTWRTYAKATEVVLPAKTFVFIEEHPDSINDTSFANACTGNQASDSPYVARIIDFPGSFHDGWGCAISFADGRSETHRWRGSKIRPLARYNNDLSLNVSAGDSWMDAQWLAENTTVRR